MLIVTKYHKWYYKCAILEICQTISILLGSYNIFWGSIENS